MTRAKAAQICQSIKFMLDKEDYSEEVEEALNMAIEALEQEPEVRTQMPSADLISRQAAIDAVHSYFKDKLDGLPTEETEEGYEVVCDMDKIDAFLSDNKYLTKRIDAIPSADRPKWIPLNAKGREPEDNGEYLLQLSDGFITATYYDGKDWELWADAGEPVAWMPLPEPYKESEE